jgi:predicted TIM-barrel fold metal-dependent hydrolase
MAATRLISAVERVVEDPGLWTRRLAKSRWADRIPHMERSANGPDRWIVDGQQKLLPDVVQVGALLDERGIDPDRWEKIPEPAYIPSRRLEAMDRNNVESAVLYPTLCGCSGELLSAISSVELELECVRAYNDWLIEEWASRSNRFIPQCILPLGSIEAAVAEIRRAVAKGHRGVIFPAAPMHLREVPHINGADYDPIWAACQDLQVPLCFHAGSAPDLFQFPVSPHLEPALAGALRAVTRPPSAVFDLVNILFSRILLRFPKLNVVFAESTIGWGAFLLEYADHQYEQDHCNYELKPSEMFRRQCYLTTWFDPVEINARHIGADRILWATNFPAANSTWPESQAFASRSLSGMSGEEQYKILRGNAAQLYGITAG